MHSEPGDLFPSWWGANDLLLMLDLGFDEGGADGMLLVSVQIGSVNSLKRLNRHWHEALKRAGISYFHSKDFGNFSSGVFTGLSKVERKRLQQRLATLIRRYADAGITLSLDTQLYESQTTTAFRSKWGSAYSFAVQMTVLASSIYLDQAGRRQNEGAHILIEDGHRNVGQAIDHLKTLTADNTTLRVLTCGRGSKKDHPILQAADMLAYGEWRKIRGGDLDVYNAIHVENERYVTEIFPIGEDLIQTATGSVAELVAKWKEAGKRRPKEAQRS